MARTLLIAVFGSLLTPTVIAAPPPQRPAVLMLRTEGGTAPRELSAAMDRAIYDGLLVQVGGERIYVEAALEDSLCRRRRCRFPAPDQTTPVTMASSLSQSGDDCDVSLRLFETVTSKTLARVKRSSTSGCEALLTKMPSAVRALVSKATAPAPANERADARHVRDRYQAVRQQISARGLLLSDLPPAYQGHNAAIKRAMAAGDYARALLYVDQLREVVEKIEIRTPAGSPPATAPAGHLRRRDREAR